MQLNVNDSVSVISVPGTSLTVGPQQQLNIGMVTVSGPAGPSGANGAGIVLQVTGSAAINPANFTGIGGTVVLYSGGQIFISGGAGGAGAGVSSLNGLTNAVNVVGTGGLSVSTNGQNILISGDGSISGALSQTGAALRSTIFGGDTNLSGQLNLTGQTLYQMLTGTSGQANTNYATAANLALTGSNLYVMLTGMSGQGVIDYATKTSLTTTGATILSTLFGGDSNLSGNLTITGQTLRALVLGGDTNLSGALTITGQTLYQIITGLSGQSNTNYATVTNLAATGSSLYTLITGTSGQAVIDYATKVQLTNTGVTLGAAIVGLGTTLSGNLTLTGQSLYQLASGTSGNLSATGVTLLGFIVGGDTNLSGNLTTTGQTLRALTLGGDTNLSGNLTTTGQTLYQLVSGTSGNLSQTGTTLLGVIASTGQQAWTAADANARNISGNLTTTGAKLSAVQVTGSSVINAVNLTGLGGTLVIQSGAFVFISGAAGGAAGVTSVDGLNGAVTITGSGTVSTFIVNGQLIISGAAAGGAGVSSVNGLQNAINIVATGLNSLTTNGQNIVISGDTSISGALASTGSNLYVILTGLSGQANTNYATVANLALTGSNLYATLTGMSGQAVTDYATKIQLTNTGVTLGATIIGGDTNLSGNLTLTGQTLRALTLGGDTNLSGQLTTSGQTLYNLITAGSGQANINYAPALANYFYTTGVQSATDIKTFASEIRLNSGLKTSATFFGPANYTLGSGNLMVIATGVLTNTTGILPNPTAVSGNLFLLVNGGTTTLQISGNVGPDINPVLQPNDAVEIYAISGAWYYIRQTGSPILGMVTSLSGYIGNVSGALQTNITANSTNLSGNLTTTGQTLFNLVIGGDTNLSGNLTLTGQTLRALTIGGDTNLSGNLTSTGQTLYQIITGTSGQGVIDYATKSALTTTGQTLYQTITGLSGQSNTNYATVVNLALTGSNLYVTLTGLSGQTVLDYATKTQLTTTGQTLGALAIGIGTNLSGNLTQTGVTLGLKTDSISGFTTGVSGALQAQISAGGSQVRVTGSSTVAIANLTGIGGTIVLYSGSQIFISGATPGAGGGVPSVNGITSAVTIMGTGNLTAVVLGSSIVISGLRLSSNKQVIFDNNGTLSGDANFIWDTLSGTLSINQPIQLLPDNPLNIGGSGVYVQSNIQNRSTRNDASSDWVATNDVGTDVSGFIDIGINGSNYNQTGYSVGSGMDGYISVNGGNLAIGTDIPGKVTRLYVGGPLYNNIVATVDPTGLALFADKSVRVSGYGHFISGSTDISNLYYPMSNPSGFVSGTQLTATGSTLYVLITGMSGQAVIDYATKVNLALTGSNLYVALTGLSGQANTNFATITNLASTGQQAWTAADANARNISGNLTTTGTLLSAVKITGSTVLNVANFTGSGSIIVSQQGQTVLIYDPKPQMVVPFSNASITWTNMPLAINFFNASTLYRTYVDLTNYTGVNLSVTLTTAGAASGALLLRYTNDPANVTQASYWPLTASGAETYTRLETANIVKQSGFSSIVAGAKSGVYIALMGQSGSAANSPVFGVINALFK